MTTALDRMPDWAWESYSDECMSHMPGSTTAELRHVLEEERENDLLGDPGAAEMVGTDVQKFEVLRARCLLAGHRWWVA